MVQLGSQVTKGTLDGRRVVVVAVDTVWCLVAYEADEQPSGALGPVWLVERALVRPR